MAPVHTTRFQHRPREQVTVSGLQIGRRRHNQSTNQKNSPESEALQNCLLEILASLCTPRGVQRENMESHGAKRLAMGVDKLTCKLTLVHCKSRFQHKLPPRTRKLLAFEPRRIQIRFRARL